MIKEQIIFKCIVGSKLYGTNNENSDTDIKGVFLPDLNDLILGKAPKHYTFSSGSKYDRNDKDDVDETYYSLQYFLELAAKGDTNAIDLLFAYTNKNVDTDEIFNKGISGKENHSGLGLWEVRQILKKNSNLNLYTNKDDKLFRQQLEIYY